MRAFLIASGVDLSASASTTPKNLQSSRLNPSIYETGRRQNVTATSASPAVFTAADVALPNGTRVILDGTPPTGFTAGVIYYVVATSGLTFELSATVGGSAINSSSTGTGVVAQSEYNAGTGANNGYDEAAAPGFAFTPGNSVVLVINSGATQAGTVVAVSQADEDPANPGQPGAYTTAASVTGVSVPQTFNIVLKQFIRVTVTTAASETGVGRATLLS